MNKKNRRSKKNRYRKTHRGEYNTTKKAVEVNSVVRKEEWIKAVKEKRWGIDIGNDQVVLAIAQPEFFEYVETIPQEVFPEFVTLFGTYEKLLLVHRYAEQIRGTGLTIFDVYIDNGFFPKKYDSTAHFSFLSSIIDMKKKAKSINTIGGLTVMTF